MKNAIPVYDICKLADENSAIKTIDFHVERFEQYLQRHSKNLHHSHSHSFYHVVLFLSGSGKHSIDFTQFPVKAGQLYCMIPGQVHSWNFGDLPEGYIVNFSGNFFNSFLLRPDYFERFAFFNGNSSDNVIQLEKAELIKVKALFEELLLQTIKIDSNSKADILRVLLLRIFLLLDEYAPGPSERGKAATGQLLIRNFNKLIERHFRTLRLPKQYADLLYVTPNHLNALCREITNKTAGELIRDRILLEAKRLLTNAALNIAEIADALNFKDNSYFSRFFRKYEKMSPENFRDQYNSYTIPSTTTIEKKYRSKQVKELN